MADDDVIEEVPHITVGQRAAAREVVLGQRVEEFPWLQALGAFQLVTVDLLLLTVAGYLLAATEVFGAARRPVALFMATYLFAWTMAWLLQLRLAGARGKSYLLLG